MKKLFVLAFLAVVTISVQAQKKDDVSVSLQKEVAGIEQMVGADMPLREALKHRRSDRKFIESKIPHEILMSLLTAANGYNRPEKRMRTAPSARNAQEIDIYVLTDEGAFLYHPENNDLEQVNKGDLRAKCSTQKHFAMAPYTLVLVANFDRMKNFDAESRDFYSAVDCGYVSQNIYLYCASMDLGTVACGAIERDMLAKALNVKNGKVMLAHPIGKVSR